MRELILRLLLRCYPEAWRAEYGPEFEDLLRRRPLGARDIGNILWSAGKERARQPVVRFWLSLFLVSVCFLAVAWGIREPLWHALSWPATQVLKGYGSAAGVLVASGPWEQLTIIWFGIPLLMTAFGVYPCLLFFTWRYYARNWPKPQRRWARSGALCSGIVFGLSLWAVLAAWQHGWPLRWLLERQSAAGDVLTHPLISLGFYFQLLVLSTLGGALLLQAPVFLWWECRRRSLSLQFRRAAAKRDDLGRS